MKVCDYLSCRCSRGAQNVGILDLLQCRAGGAELSLAAECGDGSLLGEACRQPGGGDHGVTNRRPHEMIRWQMSYGEIKEGEEGQQAPQSAKGMECTQHPQPASHRC